MNEHIELAKKFLADDTSVNLEELRANSNDAFDSWEAAYDATWDAGAAYDAAYDAAYWAYRAAYWAFRAAESNKLENAEHYKKKAIEAIAEYEELTK